MPYKLMGVDLETDTYTFKPKKEGFPVLKASASSLPTVYPNGVRAHAEVFKVIVESVKKGKKGGYVQEELPMTVIRKEKFTLDVGHTHVVECIGKVRTCGRINETNCDRFLGFLQYIYFQNSASWI
jgi:hypothetical protein